MSKTSQAYEKSLARREEKKVNTNEVTARKSAKNRNRFFGDDVRFFGYIKFSLSSVARVKNYKKMYNNVVCLKSLFEVNRDVGRKLCCEIVIESKHH